LWHRAKAGRVTDWHTLLPIIYFFNKDQRFDHRTNRTDPATLQMPSYLSRNITKPQPSSDKSLSMSSLRSIWQPRDDCR
jgi:hypothetical protein